VLFTYVLNGVGTAVQANRVREDESDLLRKLLEPRARVARRRDGDLGVKHAGVLVLVIDHVDGLFVDLVIVLHLMAQAALLAAQLRRDRLAACSSHNKPFSPLATSELLTIPSRAPLDRRTSNSLLELLLVVIERALLALEALAVEVLAAKTHVPSHRHADLFAGVLWGCASPFVPPPTTTEGYHPR
jgi:hypothetical protein